MIIITVLGLPMIIPSGNDSVLIVSVKFSLPSSTSSSYIKTLNDTLVTPAGNVTLYGPDSESKSPIEYSVTINRCCHV